MVKWRPELEKQLKPTSDHNAELLTRLSTYNQTPGVTPEGSRAASPVREAEPAPCKPASSAGCSCYHPPSNDLLQQCGFESIITINKEKMVFSGTCGSYTGVKEALGMLELFTAASLVMTRTRSDDPQFYEVVFTCRQGGKPWWESRQSRKEEKPEIRPARETSVKIGCNSRVTVHIPWPIAVREGLVEKTCSGAAGNGKLEITIHFELGHNNHHNPIGCSLELPLLPPHPSIVDKIYKLARGHTQFADVKADLRLFAHDLLDDKKWRFIERPDSETSPPLLGDPRFFPKDSVIHNHLNEARQGKRLSPSDMEALQIYMNLRSREGKEETWHFKPAVEGKRDFMLVYQSAKMKKMLRRYGNTIVGMDGTYKTDQYGHAMYIITVVTNHHNGFPVAVFWLEREDQETIGEALRVLKGWNPEWKPEFFMIDNADEEINAIHQEFPDSKPLLCTFHRKQSWQRALNDRTKFPDPVVKTKGWEQDKEQTRKTILAELYAWGDKRTEVEFKVYWTGFLNSRSSTTGRYPGLLKYLEEHWLGKAKRWAACYRATYHGGVNANNFNESINNVVKGFLERRGDKRLHSNVRVWVEEIIPKYVLGYSQHHRDSRVV